MSVRTAQNLRISALVILDAALCIREAWNEVMAMTIKNCFAKEGIGITLE